MLNMLLNNSSSRPGSNRRYIVLGEIVAVLLAFILLAQNQRASSSAVTSTASSVPVNVWMTTTSDPGGRMVVKGLEPQAAITFTDFVSPTDGRPMIWVSETITYQQVEGFGASLTDSSAVLLNPLSRTHVMQDLFNPVSGTVTFLRNPMGDSDFAPTIPPTQEPYSYDNNSEDRNDPNLPHFSITHDLTDIVPLLQQARQLNPELVLMGSPWSAPGWMKRSGTMRYKWDGALLTDYYQHYANYFVRYLRSYQDQGLNVNYISLQNEPGCCSGNMTPGMDLSGEKARIFLKDYLLPAMRADSITATKILLLDNNWSESDWVDDVADSDSLLHDPLIGGIAWHGYEVPSGITAQTKYHDKYPWLGTYLTEHSGGDWVCNQMRQDFLEIVAQMRNWSKSLVKWNLALTEQGGPTLTSNKSGGTPLITVYTDTIPAHFDYTVEYYTLGHLSKFVRSGAYRIGSSENQELPNVAFKNPDGSKVLIVYNDTPVTQTLTVVWGTRSFTYTAPAAAGLTFKWSGDQDGTTPSPWASTPFSRTPMPVPGVIQAEDYDQGGESVAYHDTDPENWGGSEYRETEGVDIECSGICTGYDVTRTQTSEWLKYTVAVTATDRYTLTVRVASAGPGGIFHLERSDGVDVTGPITIPDTGGWQNWQDVARVVSLISGTHVVRLVMDSEGSTGSVGNFDYLQFDLADTSSSNSRPYYGTPLPVPGDIQAEDYDLGGEAVAYHDTGAVNQGNQYGNDYRRTEGVDIEKCADSCDGHDVGWTQPSEWLKYTVAVTSTGQYTLTARVTCAGQGGTFHLESDGLDVSGPMAAPNTCGWQNWKDVVRVVYLTSGTHVLKLAIDSANNAGDVGNFNYLRFELADTPGGNAPYYGTPALVPGLIQVEDFDRGGEGVAYQDADQKNWGGKYRQTEGVDIGQCSGGCSENARKIGHIGYNVGWTKANELLTYTVAIMPTGLYTLTMPVASEGQGGTFHLESDGFDVSGPITVPNTGSWQNWQDVTSAISLTSGTHVLRLVMDSVGSTGDVGNLDYLRFELAGTPGDGPYHGTPAPVPGKVEAEDFDWGGEGAAYHDTDPENRGNEYRPAEGVDIGCNDTCTEHNVGWTKPGEWLIYTVEITPSGLYTFTAHIASAGPGGVFHLESDGADISGPITVPNTGGWQNWQDIARVVYLGSGTHVLRLAMDSPNCASSIVDDIGNFDYLQFDLASTPGSSTPYHGTPAPVPGLIQVEDYDRGGESMAYHDTDPENWGGQYRKTEGVDIECSNDTCTRHDVAYTKAREWLTYTVAVTPTGLYTLTVRVASAGSGGVFHLESDGFDVSRPITAPDTGGWQNWQDVTRAISLTSGTHVLGLVMDSAGATGDIGNLDYFTLSTPLLAVTKQATPDPVQAGAQLTYTVRVTNTGGVALTATITDTLPDHVIPGGTRVWTATIPALGDVWTRQFTVAVACGYSGTLTNVVQVTTEEGASGIYTETSQALVAPVLITVTPNPVAVTVGATQTFTATGVDECDDIVPISPTWSTDAGTMIGNILTAQTTPVSGLHVTATVGSVSGTAAVNVTVGPLNRLTITPTVITLTMYATQQFTAAGFDAYTNVITHPSITWYVTSSDIGRIDATGWFTAGNKAGVYPKAIVVASGSISATAKVIIVPYQVYLPVVRG